jgi:hypothetical protein
MVGIKPVADQLLKVYGAVFNPVQEFGTLLNFGGSQIAARLRAPDVPVRNRRLVVRGSRSGCECVISALRFKPC